MKPTAKTAIINRLSSGDWIAVHEFGLFGYSETAISARLREMARVGIVEGRFRANENFKEWRLSTSPQIEDIPVIDLKWEENQASWL